MKNKQSYQPIIGLEIHIELKTKSKMFCGCKADHFQTKPNTQVCPTCLGLPGALPVANKKAIEWTVLAGLTLNCQIPKFSKFDRKNYFYPDLPKGYQISQYDLPFAKNGKLKLEGDIGITRVHLEEDTAKMIHKGDSTLIDFNRSGVPLMEIVTEPDIHSGIEAKVFLKKLQQIIRYLQISDCDMEKGTMRCEPNISLSKPLATKLPDYKVEIKNLNSFRFVEKSIDYEIIRQTKILNEGKIPKQETRGWDENKQKTYTQRWKEKAQDYRYFPEPDLPPIRWEKSDINNFKKLIPELPDQKINRFVRQFNLLKSEAEILTASLERAAYFEDAAKIGKKLKLKPRDIAKVIVNKRLDPEKHSPSGLVKAMAKSKSKKTMAKDDLDELVKRILGSNPAAVKDFNKGKKTAVEFLLGQVMRESKGTADPNEARIKIISKLKQHG